jgi:hypothetical protein
MPFDNGIKLYVFAAKPVLLNVAVILTAVQSVTITASIGAGRFHEVDTVDVAVLNFTTFNLDGSNMDDA